MYDLKDNVARKAGSMGKEESKEIMFWTQEEYQAFIEQVRTSQSHIMHLKFCIGQEFVKENCWH